MRTKDPCVDTHTNTHTHSDLWEVNSQDDLIIKSQLGRLWWIVMPQPQACNFLVKALSLP